MEYVALRYSNVYGPRQDPHGEAGVVAIFSSRLMAGEPLTIFGDGEQTRDYIYVGDVVSANMVVSELSMAGDGGMDAVAFNVGTGREASVNLLANTLEEVAGVRPGRHFEPARAGELRHSCLDTQHLEAQGWACTRTLEEGLRETYEYIAKGRGAA
jgi:UDP-glucose 4-epimerase